MQLFWYTMQLLPNYTALICVCFADVYIVHFVLIKHRDFFSAVISQYYLDFKQYTCFEPLNSARLVLRNI